MARIRDPNRDKAHEIYKQHKGDITNRAIADELGIDEKKVAVWKQRDKWNVVQQTDNSKKSVVQQKAKEKKQQSARATPKVDVPVIENDELTDKQRLFISYYLKYWNATKAYQKAYDCAYSTAMTNGNALLRNTQIAAEIQRTRDEIFAESFLSSQAIIQKYMDIAFADITDFVEFGKKEVQAMGAFGPLEDDEGDPIMVEVNYVDLKSHQQVDGTIISEVKKGKDGVSVKLADRMKALEKLEKYIGMMSEEQKARIEKLKGDIMKVELEIKDRTGESADDPHEQVKSYEAALNAQAGDVFSDG